MKERNSSYQYSPIQDINTSISNTTTTSTNSSTYISTILKFISNYQTFLVFLIGILLGFYFHFIIHNFSFFWFQLQTSYKHEMVSTVMHISDTHIDYFFNPNQSSLSKGVCHSCDLVWTCPKLPNNLTEYETRLRQHGYAFGRYGCNPPHLLFQSLIHQMKEIDPNPNVIIFTGDISPHAYPDDYYEVTKQTTLSELCELKFDVTKIMIQELVKAFPNTRWAYTLGNNDHFPKDLYWQPYITRYGDMLLETGFFTHSQYDSFISHGCNYIDVDGIRYLSVDMMVFAPSGIAFVNSTHNSNHPSRIKVELLTRLLSWLEDSLDEAARQNLPVYLLGHQPMTTKDGRDEMDVESEFYQRFKTILSAYSSIIKVALFGHHNYAFVEEVMSTSFIPMIPSIIAPGVSPRGKNNPAFHIIYQSKKDGTILDFKQMKFDLFHENHMARLTDKADYLGKWSFHSDLLYSWRSLSGEKNFTAETLFHFLSKVPKSKHLFEAMQVWRTAGYIGEDTPEGYRCRAKYDQVEPLMKCLFPEQNASCWSPREWLSWEHKS